jgi:hypothetical protein
VEADRGKPCPYMMWRFLFADRDEPCPYMVWRFLFADRDKPCPYMMWKRTGVNPVPTFEGVGPPEVRLRRNYPDISTTCKS